MKKIHALVLFAAIAFAIPPLPRKSPEFTIVEPGGKQTLLTSYKGKVILLGFFSTACPHCQHTAQAFNSLFEAYGKEGLQCVGIAIDPRDDDPRVREFQHLYAPLLPVGKASQESALSYLGISVMDRRLVYPQVVVIDRHGMIREQSDPKGTAELQEATALRPRIEALLKER